ncbi:FUSC family protein [Synechococcus lacustris Tous-12m]
MTAELNQQALKNAIKYFVAAAIAGSIALATDQVSFIWYPLLAVVMCMDETETRVIAASRGRMLGTVAAGVVGFVVHTVLQGWVALTVSLLILVPILRWCRWQAGLATGVVLLSMLFLVAEYSSLDWLYILNRTIDTLIGVLVAIAVSNLLWPINRLAEIYSLDLKLRQLLSKRLLNIQQLLFGTAQPPQKLKCP